MKKYKVKCEDRVYFTITVEADSEELAIEEACRLASKRTERLDVYDVLSVEEVKKS